MWVNHLCFLVAALNKSILNAFHSHKLQNVCGTCALDHEVRLAVTPFQRNFPWQTQQKMCESTLRMGKMF